VKGPDANEPDATAGRASRVRRTMFWLTLGTLVYLGGQWLLTVIGPGLLPEQPDVSSGHPS